MYNNFPPSQMPFYNSMPNSYSQIVASTMPVYPPAGFQTQGISGINQMPQQSIPPANFQMNPNSTLQAQPPMVVNPIAAPITSAMRIQAAKSSRISWRNVHDLDIEALKKSNDIETLESYLPNLLDSIVTQEEYEKLKPEALVNLLQICQMSLQYFDYTQDYLENLSNETQDEINKILKKVDEDKKVLKKSKREIEKMKSEIDIKKEAIKKYKDFLKQRPQYKCHICINKFFANEDYLDAHIKRRHAHVLPMNANHPNFAVMQNMVFAQQLQKERLEFERQQKLLLKNEKFQKDDVIDKLELILQKNRQEQAELQLEMQRRLKDIESQQNQVINKKQQENEFQRQQIVDLMQNMNKIHDEITNLKYREVVIQQTTQNEQRESQLQELYKKQNELFENNQKLKMQQIELEKQKEKQLLEEKKRLELLKQQNSFYQETGKQQNNNDDLIKQLIGEDNYGKRVQSNVSDKQQIPSEIKRVTKQISEIKGNRNGNQIDKETIEELNGIYLGNPDKVNQKQQPQQKIDPQQQANKFNSIASNMILQGHNAYNQKQNTNEEDILEEGEVLDDEYYQSEDEEQNNSYDTNENDISKDREFNNQCEEEKENLDLNFKNKTDKNKQLQVDHKINKKLSEQGITQPIENLKNLPNKEVEQILDQVKNPNRNNSKKNNDFDDDFEQSKGNNQGTNQSGKGILHSSRKNQALEESSQNYDESGYYNGSKGRTYELQANPTSLNKQLQSFGDSYTETLYQNKKQKKFAYEDSDEF